MESPEPTDSRGYFLIPQAYEGGGFYVYGTPDKERGQYAHPQLISALLQVARSWSYLDKRKFGVGNICLSGGGPFKGHKSHRSGLEVDIRPVRKGGNRLPCSIFDKQYDRDATAALIALFRKHSKVQLVLFNDRTIQGVSHASNHSDHFHVQIAVAA